MKWTPSVGQVLARWCVAAFAGALTPYGGLELSEGGTRGYRLGARFLLGPAFETGLEGERRKSRIDRAEHGLMLRGTGALVGGGAPWGTRAPRPAHRGDVHEPPPDPSEPRRFDRRGGGTVRREACRR